MDNVSCDMQKRTISGKAVVYNSVSRQIKDNTGTYKEVILPGTFTEDLKRSAKSGEFDVRALLMHDPNKLLGRTSSGTLRLRDTQDGLEVEIDVPDTTYANDMLALAQRGDLRNFSFGFKPVKERKVSKNGTLLREVSSAILREVSVVDEPAYEAATLSLRSSDFVVEDEVTATPTEVVATVAEASTPAVEVRTVTETPTVDASAGMNMSLRLYENYLRGITSSKTPNIK